MAFAENRITSRERARACSRAWFFAPRYAWASSAIRSRGASDPTLISMLTPYRDNLSKVLPRHRANGLAATVRTHQENAGRRRNLANVGQDDALRVHRRYQRRDVVRGHGQE